MGWKFRAFLAALFAIVAVPLAAEAAAYVDDMTDMNNNDIKSYQGLAPYPLTVQQQSAWSRLPDLTMHTFAAPAAPKGSALYRVQGAQSITVSLYSHGGTFVAGVPGEAGRYSCGPTRPDLGYLSNQQVAQAQYSPSQNAVYAKINGSLHKAYHNDYYYEFLETKESPGDLIGYGVNIFVSTNGSTYAPVSLKLTGAVVEAGIAYIYEQYTASIPAGTSYVRVELNDATQIHSVKTTGGTQAPYSTPKSSWMLSSLASVSFTGDRLVLGEPQELSSESGRDGDSDLYSEREDSDAPAPSSARSSSSSKSSSSKAASIPSAAGSVAGGAALSGSSSSKFEGVITAPSNNTESSQASTRPSSSSTVQSIMEAESLVVAQQSSQQEEIEVTQGVLYEVHSNQKNSGRSIPLLIVAYLVIIAGIIVFIATRAKK